jgi:hypothetical protein
LFAAAVSWISQSRFGVAMQVVIVLAAALSFALAALVRHLTWLLALAQGRALFEPYGGHRSGAEFLPWAVMATAIAVPLSVGLQALLEVLTVDLGVRPRVPIVFLSGMIGAAIGLSRHRRDSTEAQGVRYGPLRPYLIDVVTMTVALTAPLVPLLYVVRYGPLIGVTGVAFSHHTSPCLLGLLSLAAGLSFARVACEHRAGTVVTDTVVPRRAGIIGVVIIAVLTGACSALYVVPLPNIRWWPGLAITLIVTVVVGVGGAVGGALAGSALVAPNPWRSDESL